MLILSDCTTEARERHLIELTAKAAELAQHPIGSAVTDALCDLAREILHVAGSPIAR